MTNTSRTCATQCATGSAVLLARIVDRRGRPVRPAEIDAIEFRAVPLGPSDSDTANVFAEHQSTLLNVGKVMFDSLQTDDVWTVDNVGYNFHHEIDFRNSCAFPLRSRRFEARYVFTSTAGEKSIVRFKLVVGC